jgi:hypothetical protein
MLLAGVRIAESLDEAMIDIAADPNRLGIADDERRLAVHARWLIFGRQNPAGILALNPGDLHSG